MSNEDTASTGWLWHVKNIKEGRATVIWSTTYGAVGWQAPGGASTTDERVARQWAKQMDALMRKAG